MVHPFQWSHKADCSELMNEQKLKNGGRVDNPKGI